jgi:adenosylmethionine-8-amino-7-oxononanoate aminotransferase
MFLVQTADKTDKMDIKAADKKYFGRSEKTGSFELVESKGSLLIDKDGNEYIDFLMGWCVGNLGWENEEIKKEMETFKGPEYVHPSLLYKPWVVLAELLAEITPGQLQVSYRTTGGSEAVEAALQIAMLYTGRGKFLSLENSYHGNSIAGLSIGASESKKKFKNLLPNCLKLDVPLDAKALKKAETLLRKKEIAAFIMEPVPIALGVLQPEREFMEGVDALCKKYGTLLIMDEVATGFGRTGKLFASEYYDIKPDIMCLAKAVSGGYGGLGATITTEKIAKKVKGDLNIYSTYGWHPLSVHSAIANINYLTKHKDELLKRVAEAEAKFHSRLSLMKFKTPAEVHVKGLAISIDVKKEKYANKIKEKCLAKGLFIHAEETRLFIFPAMNIPDQLIDQGLDILENCL